MRFDDAIKLLESGVPLDKMEPIDIVKIHAPPPPPQPKFQYTPSAAGLVRHMLSLALMFGLSLECKVELYQCSFFNENYFFRLSNPMLFLPFL